MKAIPLPFVLPLLFLEFCYGHWTSAYTNTDSGSLKPNPTWMSKLPDSVPLSAISIPGTHESLARGYGEVISECQSLTLEQQLEAGVRGLDVRCRHISNSFAIHHGIVFMHLMFGDVLNVLESFLQINPSETVIVRIKEEHTPENVTRSFEVRDCS